MLRHVQINNLNRRYSARISANGSPSSNRDLGIGLSVAIGLFSLVAPSMAIASQAVYPNTDKDYRCVPAADGVSWDCTKASLPKSADLLSNMDIQPLENWNWLRNPSNGKPATSCHSYVEPARNWQSSHLNPANAKFRAKFARKTLDRKGNLILAGNAQFQQGNSSGQSSRIVYDARTGNLEMEGISTYRRPNEVYRANYVELKPRENEAFFESAQYLNYRTHARTEAARMEQTGDKLVMSNAKYTTCAPKRELWSIRGSEITLNYDTGTVSAKKASLRVAGIPVFYSPSMSFSLDDRRDSGILWPSVGYHKNVADVQAQYYWNMRENRDLTLGLRGIEDHGTMLQFDFRNLSEKGLTTYEFERLSDDKLLEIDRNYTNFQTDLRLNKYFSFKADYQDVSDRAYFSDFSIDSLDEKRLTSLGQFFELGADFGPLEIALRKEKLLALGENEHNYVREPELSINYRPQSGYFVEPILRAEHTEFDHRDSYANGGNKITGTRTWGEAGLRFPFEGRAGFIIAEAKGLSLSYELDDGDLIPLADDAPSISGTSTSVDMGLFIERNFKFARRPWVQTFEPRVFYLKRDVDDAVDQNQLPVFDTTEAPITYQSIFRDSRFTGNDRLDDADQFAVGFTSRIISTDLGQEVFRFGVGQVLYNEDVREIRLGNNFLNSRSVSEFAAEMVISPTKYTEISTEITYEPDQSTVSYGNFNVHYAGKYNSVFNMGYTYRREANFRNRNPVSDLPTEQFNISAALPLGKSWKAYGAYHQDVERKRTAERSLGFEYDSCCIRTRVTYQYGAEPEYNTLTPDQVLQDESLMLEFQLSGLGGFGDRIGKLLEERIFGYESK